VRHHLARRSPIVTPPFAHTAVVLLRQSMRHPRPTCASKSSHLQSIHNIHTIACSVWSRYSEASLPSQPLQPGLARSERSATTSQSYLHLTGRDSQLEIPHYRSWLVVSSSRFASVVFAAHSRSPQSLVMTLEAVRHNPTTKSDTGTSRH
jgi:hypothetical protein